MELEEVVKRIRKHLESEYSKYSNLQRKPPKLRIMAKNMAERKKIRLLFPELEIEAFDYMVLRLKDQGIITLEESGDLTFRKDIFDVSLFKRWEWD